MIGRLGRPYRFFYSSKNYVSGLSDVVAQVKKPNGSFHGNYTLSEFTGGLFDGTYYFDIPTTQNDPEGEYVVVIVEQTSLTKVVQKVTLDLNTSDGGSSEPTEPELFGKLIDEKLTGQILSNDSLKAFVSDHTLSATLSAETIVALVEEMNLNYKIKEEYLTGKLSECNQ